MPALAHSSAPAPSLLHMQWFGSHDFNGMEQLWPSGALAALTVTWDKSTPLDSSAEHLEDMAALVLGVAEPDWEPEPHWFDTPQQQECALFLLARMGSKAAAAVQAWRARPAGARDAEQEASVQRAAADLHGAAVHLGQQPVVRQLLQVAAPGVLPLLDAAGWQPGAEAAARGALPGADAVTGATQSQQQGSSRRTADQQPDVARQAQTDALEVLLALGRQYDPLALGLRLRGCYNPACTSLAGASEADMKLKICASCRIARCAGWVGVLAAAARPPARPPAPGRPRGQPSQQHIIGAVVWPAHAVMLSNQPCLLCLAGTAAPSVPRRTGSTTRPAASARRRRRRRRRRLPSRQRVSSRSRGGGGSRC